MGRFRKKSLTVEAIQWDGSNFAAIQNFASLDHITEVHGLLFIPTKEGVMQARVGDWIVRGVMGEIYPIKPDIFAATYEVES